MGLFWMSKRLSTCILSLPLKDFLLVSGTLNWIALQRVSPSHSHSSSMRTFCCLNLCKRIHFISIFQPPPQPTPRDSRHISDGILHVISQFLCFMLRCEKKMTKGKTKAKANENCSWHSFVSHRKHHRRILHVGHLNLYFLLSFEPLPTTCDVNKFSLWFLMFYYLGVIWS